MRIYRKLAKRVTLRYSEYRIDCTNASKQTHHAILGMQFWDPDATTKDAVNHAQ